MSEAEEKNESGSEENGSAEDNGSTKKKKAAASKSSSSVNGKREFSFGGGIKVGSRVRRSGVAGSHGVVKDIREETTASADTRGTEKGLLISVMWDNGTLSYFSSEALEKAPK